MHYQSAQKEQDHATSHPHYYRQSYQCPRWAESLARAVPAEGQAVPVPGQAVQEPEQQAPDYWAVPA